jgi:NADH:ubiquinone oxidoreductase subunit 4 (subunit M)
VESSREFPGGWLIAVLSVWLALALAGAGLLRTLSHPHDGWLEAAFRQPSLSVRDLAGILPLVAAILWLGLSPQTFLNCADASLFTSAGVNSP